MGTYISRASGSNTITSPLPSKAVKFWLMRKSFDGLVTHGIEIWDLGDSWVAVVSFYLGGFYLYSRTDRPTRFRWKTQSQIVQR
jgi:hypothetical protein